jgi:hypothetical protein
VSPLGISDEVQARELAQPGVGDGPPRQRGVVHGELRDHEILEAPDAVGPGGAHRHPAGEVLAEAVLQRQHRRGSAQLEHVDRILVLSERRDWHCRVFLSHGQRDVRIRGVFEVRDDEPRVGCPHGVVGGNGVDVAHHDDDSIGVELGRGRRVGLDHAVLDGLVLEALDQAAGQLVVAADDHVSAQVRGHFAGSAHPQLCLEPGRVEEADEGEGKDDQQQQDPGEQHRDAEEAPEVAVESDVSEAEGAHHRERPVETGEPGMLLALMQHHQVEQHRVEQNGAGEERQVLEQCSQVASRFLLLEEVRDLRREKLHWRVLPRSGG